MLNMSRDYSDSSRPDGVSTTGTSPQRSSMTTSGSNSNITVSVHHDEKEHLGSISHESSPKLTSILLPSSENSVARPRSSDGRVTSLNLPKRTSHHSRSHMHSPGSSKRRGFYNGSLTRNDVEGHNDGRPNVATDDGVLNFGLGDDFTLAPEDPKILEDVQRALKAKALRESRSRTDATASVSRTSMAELSDEGANEDARSLAKAITVPFPVTPPKPVISISTHSSPLHPAAPPKIVFPSYTHSPVHSLESISSFGHLIRSPIPVRATSQEGVTWLDWSGAPPEPVTSEKEKTLLGRTFSLTKRKSKAKGRIASLSGRNSLDFRASQGELYAASLDSIRRAARRDTLSRAEMTKDELGRRYAFLTSHKPTGEPELDILDVVKSRQDHTKIHTPWLAWCRLLLLSQQKTNEWILTADSIDEYLQRSGRRPTRPPLISPSTPINVSAKRPHSPGFGFSSPLSSPRSSLSTSPLANSSGRRRDRKSLELGRSLSANPIVEGMAGSPSLSRTLSRSLSLTRATSTGSFTTSLIENRRSADVVRPENSSYTNLNTSPRSSLDRGSDSQLLSKVVKSENGIYEKKKYHASLPAEKAKLSLESRTSTVSSIPNLLGAAQPHGGVATTGRLHLGVGKMFGRKRTNGDEVAGENIVHSRSSVSDERDSAREGEGTKSDDGGRLKAGVTLGTPGLDLRGLMTRGKEVLSTSDSETNGLLSVKLGRRLRRIDRDHDKDRVAEDVAVDIARDSLSGGEQWQVDALAAPGWTTTRGVRRARTSAPKEIGREKLQELLQKREEDEERENEIYQAREQLLIEANDHNRRIARLLKLICVSIRDHENDQSELAQALGFPYQPIPAVVLDAVSADPATSLRHGKGYQAVEDSYQRFNCRHSLLTSYLETLRTTPEHGVPCDMSGLIEEAEKLWQRLQVKSKEIEEQAKLVIPALQRAVEHMAAVQKEYNITQMIAETDYSEQSRITDLEMIITESRAPRGWLEFAAVWIPEHVLEFIGGFIRFFGVPISEKFIRPFLWYFFRNRYYWKVYSTEPPPSERAWYTRLGYWIVILSILAWYSTV